MSSSDLDLRIVQFQSQLRSKPVKLNFDEIQTEFNSLRAEVYASIASTAAEVISARDNYSNLTDNVHARVGLGDTIRNDQQFIPSSSVMNFSATGGQGIANGVGVYMTAGGTEAVSAPAAGYVKKGILLVDPGNTIEFLDGTPTTGTPVFPAIGNVMPLAHVTVYDTTNTLAPIDVRGALLDPLKNEDYFDATYSYSGNTLTTYTVTTNKGLLRQYAMSYSGQTIASLGVTIDNYRYTRGYTFSGNTMTNSTFRMA